MKFDKSHLFLAFLILISITTMFLGCPTPSRDSKTGMTPVPREQRENAVAIYFSKTQGSQNITEEVARNVPPSERGNTLTYALTELLRGPTPQEKAQGFHSEIPKGTRLLGISRKGDAVTIDLSHHFTGGGGSTSIQQRLEEVEKTIFAADSKHKIYLTIEGKPLETLGGEGLEVPQPLKRDIQ